MKILTVTLNPALDKVVAVKELVLGQEIRAEEIQTTAGGKGINVVRALKGLGVKAGPPCTMTVQGGPAGSLLKEKLGQEGIEADFVTISGSTRINLSIMEDRSGKTTRILETGPFITPKEFHSFKKKLVQKTKQYSWVVFCGSIPQGLGSEVLAELVRAVGPGKAIVDTSGAALKSALAARPFMIKPNRAEAELVLGKKLDSLLKLKSALEYFRRRQIPEVIISLGPQGAVASQGHESWRALYHDGTGPAKYRHGTGRAKTVPVKKVHALGSGDSMIAGYLYARIKKKDFPEALQWAVAAGTANCLDEVPGRIHLETVRRLVRKIHIKKI